MINYPIKLFIINFYNNFNFLMNACILIFNPSKVNNKLKFRTNILIRG